MYSFVYSIELIDCVRSVHCASHGVMTNFYKSKM